MIVLLLVVVFAGFANGEEVNEYDELKLNITIASEIVADGRVRNLELGLSFFPKNDEFQKIMLKEIKARPEAEISENGEIKYKWESLDNGKAGINNAFVVASRANFKKIDSKIKFPLEDVNGLDEYLKATELINADDKMIKAKAAELASGLDDEYSVAFEIGRWVKENINYSLETLTEGATKDAGWVLENRKGVCDELTVLYIAMLRSLNIPAKFVSGSSYSNIIDGFGNHAWASVYFPGYGWADFDVTYGQLGWVDAGHVKMDESYDAGKSGISYSWRTRDGNVRPGALKVDVNVVEKGGVAEYDLGLDVKLLNNKVKGGSFVPVGAEVENKGGFYLPVNVYLTKGPKNVSDNERLVLLKPWEKKKVFFLVSVPGELNKGFMYTSDVEVKASFGGGDGEMLEYASIYDFGLTENEAYDKIKELSGESQGESFGELDVICVGEKEAYYKYELNGELTCKVKNKGSKNFEGLKICMLDDCRDFNLMLVDEKSFEFVFNISDVKQEIKVVVSGDGIVKYGYADVKILERPGINIEGLDYPHAVGYGENGVINFTLGSRDEINNLVIFVAGEDVFSIKSFVNVNKMSVPFKGEFFIDKKPELLITYEDRNNARYELREELDISVVNIPWYAGILEFFKRLRREG